MKFFYVVKETQDIKIHGTDDYGHTEYEVVKKFSTQKEAEKYIQDHELPVDEEIEMKSEKTADETMDIDVFYRIVEMDETKVHDQAYIQEHFHDWKPESKK